MPCQEECEGLKSKLKQIDYLGTKLPRKQTEPINNIIFALRNSLSTFPSLRSLQYSLLKLSVKMFHTNL